MWLAQQSWDKRPLMGRGDRKVRAVEVRHQDTDCFMITWVYSSFHQLKANTLACYFKAPFSPALINFPWHKTFMLSFKSNKTCYLQSWKLKSTSKFSDKSLQLKPDKMKTSSKQKGVPSRPVLCTLLFQSSCSSYASHLSVVKHCCQICKTTSSRAGTEESEVPSCEPR